MNSLLDQAKATWFSGWRKCLYRMPPPDSPVLAFYRTREGVGTVVRAIWVPQFSKVDEGFRFEPAGESEYDRVTDEVYWPEGWYEWNEHEDTHWRVDEEVTHWMPLPDFPEDVE